MATKPTILRQGDTIGIVTIGSPLDASTINANANTLRNMGFNVVFGRYTYASTGMIAGSAQQRASDLMSMFQNPDVDMILPTRGGVGVAGILPYLDYNIIRNNPKIISGYSDVTILLNVLYQKANLITFQSLLLINFNPTTPAYNYNEFFQATSTTISPRVIENPPGMPLTRRVSGNVTGPIVGGNLTSFVDSLGTPYEIDTRGKILLIEETHEPSNNIFRMLTQLSLAGKLRDCIGIIMGECTNCTRTYNTSYDDLIEAVLVPLGKPLISNLATAHGTYKAAIPIGAQVNLNATEGRITVMEPTVKV